MFVFDGACSSMGKALARDLSRPVRGFRPLAVTDAENPIPPITAYYVMKIGKLVLLPYYAPGDMSLANAVREVAGQHHAILLANHGPIVAGKNLQSAVYASEELEETAKLFLLLRGNEMNILNSEQVAALRAKWPS